MAALTSERRLLLLVAAAMTLTMALATWSWAVESTMLCAGCSSDASFTSTADGTRVADHLGASRRRGRVDGPSPVPVFG